MLNYFKMEMFEDSILNSPTEKNDCFLSMQREKQVFCSLLCWNHIHLYGNPFWSPVFDNL